MARERRWQLTDRSPARGRLRGAGFALTRRELLRRIGAIGVGGAIGGACSPGRRERVSDRPASPDQGPPPAGIRLTTASGQAADTGVLRWSDPSAWASGQVPGPDEVAAVTGPVLLDVDALVGGVRIEPNGAVIFPADSSVALSSKGNVVVRGSLVMRPGSPAVVHALRFPSIDEMRFTGGGDEVKPTDIGLWVEGPGVLDLAGSPKRSWSRATSGLSAGGTSLEVFDASGWREGDRLAIAPTTPPSLDAGGAQQDADHARTYDEAVITRVLGGTITLDHPLTHPHPMVEFADWDGEARSYGAEVLNLSRNVVVEGTPSGRAHVMLLQVERPQALSHVEIRHVGPRQQDPENAKKTASVLGRYGLHFHKAGEGSRGTVLDGVVVHGCGGHAFVPHDSHGITMRDCVAHDVGDSAFWWDLRTQETPYRPASHDILWERCVASAVRADASTVEGSRMAGFYLGDGSDLSNRCIDCVAVGVHGAQVVMNSLVISGFHWPARARSRWHFSGCLAHNMGGSGILSWQNDEKVHLIERFTAYHCGKSGIDHGAYSNFWEYRNCSFFANRRAGLAVHAVTRRTRSVPDDAPPLTFRNVAVDGGGITRWGIQAERHRFAAPEAGPTLIERAAVIGCREASYYEPSLVNRSNVLLSQCRLSKPEFVLHDDAAPETLIRVEGLAGHPGSFTLRQKDQAGELVPAWNARRSGVF